MKKINIIKMMKEEQESEKNYNSKISSMRTKDFIYDVLQDQCADLTTDIVYKIDEEFDDEYLFDVIFLGIERLWFSNERKKEYYSFLETKDIIIRQAVIDKMCEWLKNRKNIYVIIDEYIKEYLSSKLKTINIDYDTNSNNEDNKLLSKYVFYKILSYYDAYMIYECGLCDIDVEDDERAFLICNNTEIKERMANTIFDEIKKENKGKKGITDTIIDEIKNRAKGIAYILADEMKEDKEHFINRIKNCDDFTDNDFLRHFDSILHSQYF